MQKKRSQSIVSIIVMSLVLQLAACGTLMYPERRGQKAGEIDVKVAVLDGIGLLFFIVPGLVAYVVDFSTGAIYLPAGKRNMVQHLDGENYYIHTVYVKPETLKNQEAVKEIVSKEMGLPSIVDWSKLKSNPISSEQITMKLAKTQAIGFAQ
jgi:hypothetical protein